jgi:hypothetical protein
MVPPELEKVVADCDAALAIDRNYIKALNRRATALEGLEQFEEALRGWFWTLVSPTRTDFIHFRLHCCDNSGQVPERPIGAIG